MELTAKQIEYWNNANHRWNVKEGAVRSGKTYLDYYLIPKRIRSVAKKDGLIVVLGNTKGTLRRNVIEPMQNIWGSTLVGDIKADNTATWFGEKVHCIGADKQNRAEQLQGSSIKYCYGDEITTWNEEVFNMLKSRLDKSYSLFEGTCNPDTPNHWFHKFLEKKDIDIFRQHYTLFDNDFLPDDVKRNIELEYKGTVYYDRYVLGKWARAEGICFRQLAEHKQDYLVSAKELPSFRWVKMGYDLGGNNSYYGLVVVGMGYDDIIYVLRAVEIEPDGLRTTDVEQTAKDFITRAEADYFCRISTCYVDDNYYTTVNDLNAWRYIFDVASRIKSHIPLVDRPKFMNKQLNTKRIKFVVGECEPLIEQLSSAVYDERAEQDIILDDGSMRIDLIDSFFYAIADDYYHID